TDPAYLVFDELEPTATFTVTGTDLSSPITITAPNGFSVDIPSIDAGAGATVVTATFDATADVVDYIILTSGESVDSLTVHGRLNSTTYTPLYEEGNLVSHPYMNTLDSFNTNWGAENRSIVTDPSLAYSGKGSLFLAGSTCSTSFDETFNNLFESNTLYEIRAMVKTEGDYKFILNSFDVNGQNDFFLDTINTNGEWEQYYQVFKTGTLPTTTQNIYFNNCEAFNGSGAYMDNYEIYKMPPNSDAKLKSLSTDIGTFDAAFDPETDAYELEVPYGTTQIDIDAVANNLATNITYFDGLGNELEADGIVAFTGDGIDIEIALKSSDGTEMSYYLAIFVGEGASDASLNDIDLSISAIDPIFNVATKEYTVLVPTGTTTVDVTAIPNFSGATITGGGTITLSGEETTVNLAVTSEDESATDSYTLTIKEADGNNYALSLPGESGAASHVDITGLDLNSLSYTIEMWFKPEGTQISRTGLLFARHPETNDNAGIQYLDNASLTGMSNESIDLEGVNTGTVIDAAWHHVAFVVEDSTRSIYLDGAETTQSDINLMVDYTTCQVYLGWDNSSNDRAFKGLIDEVRVWNTIRTAQEINTNKYEVLNGDEAGLISYYNFDINSPTRAIDIASSANNGEMLGASYVASFPRANLELTELSIAGANLYPTFAVGVTEFYTVLPQGTTTIDVVATTNSSSATVAGNGVITVGDTGTVVLTVTEGEFSLDYTIHYQTDAALTLMHSYSFADGTAKDATGDADGTLYGDAYIKEGMCISDTLGGYVSFPADKIAINTYPSVTFELYIQDTESTNTSANTMFNYFGGHNGGVGKDGVFINPKTRAAIFCKNYTNPWTAESGIDGTNLQDDAAYHHVVGVLNNDSIGLYIDGQYMGATQTSENNKIYNLVNEVAYLFRSGYNNDNSWLGSFFQYNIYQGIMDAETISLRAFDIPQDEAANDATLSDMTVADTTVAGFRSTYMEYTVTVPFGAALPTLAAMPKEEGATAEVTPAEAIPGTATIVVTSFDEAYTNTYTVNFVSAENPNDATLSNLTVADTTIAGFDTAVLNYEIEVSSNDA
ncbi:MAG: cadherin-like beta sandwich domain-containing protein, partial [Bacteroidales bacterium]|nr:cadherin-like beta sandwich domain-containing protein [Bacteroidales bacterium]